MKKRDRALKRKEYRQVGKGNINTITTTSNLKNKKGDIEGESNGKKN